MISGGFRAGRNRPPRRAEQKSDQGVAGQVRSYGIPSGGLITANPQGGVGFGVLENFWPTERGLELRRGVKAVRTLSATVQSLFGLRASGMMFAATNTDIHRVDTGASVLSGRAGGDYSTVEVQNSGGSFLIVVNGKNAPALYDGKTWTTDGTTFKAGAVMSSVWAHRNRVWFTQAGSLSAWFLSVNAIRGQATELPLDGVFRSGGSLIGGATWSSDSGRGMDDRCVFLTNQGEVAIYSGANPENVSGWALEGVYSVGAVLGERPMVSLGGDVLFATKRGIIPLSGVVSKDPSMLATVSYAAPIAPTWAQLAEAGRSTGVRLAVVQELGQLHAYAPGHEWSLLVNLATQEWTKIIGWSMRALFDMPGGATMASSTKVAAFWTSGNDFGSPIVHRAAVNSDPLGSPASLKQGGMARATWLINSPVSYAVEAAWDGAPGFWAVVPPMVASVDTPGAEWDKALWDTATWADGASIMANPVRDAHWRNIGGAGNDVSLQVQAVINSVAPLSGILSGLDLQYSGGGIDI